MPGWEQQLISGLNKQKIRWLLQSGVCKCEQWSWLTARKVEMKESVADVNVCVSAEIIFLVLILQFVL